MKAITIEKEDEFFNKLENELDDLKKDGKLTDDNRERILKIAMKFPLEEDRKEYYESLPIVAEVDESRLSSKELMKKIEKEIDDLIKEGAKIDKEKTLKVAMKFSKIERYEYYDSLFPGRKRKLTEIEEKFKEEIEEEAKNGEQKIKDEKEKGLVGKTFKFIRKLKEAVW